MTLTVDAELQAILQLPINRKAKAIKIMEYEAAKARCDVGKLLAGSRKRTIVQVRWRGFYHCRHTLKLSFPVIGELFGYDHTSVIHGVRVVEERIRTGHITDLELPTNEHPLYPMGVSPTPRGYDAPATEEHPDPNIRKKVA